MATTLADIRKAERKRIMFDDMFRMADRIHKQAEGKYLAYCKMMGYELDENGSTIELIEDDEILNGLIGLMGNAALIMDWTYQ